MAHQAFAAEENDRCDEGAGDEGDAEHLAHRPPGIEVTRQQRPESAPDERCSHPATTARQRHECRQQQRAPACSVAGRAGRQHATRSRQRGQPALREDPADSREQPEGEYKVGDFSTCRRHAATDGHRVDIVEVEESEHPAAQVAEQHQALQACAKTQSRGDGRGCHESIGLRPIGPQRLCGRCRATRSNRSWPRHGAGRDTPLWSPANVPQVATGTPLGPEDMHPPVILSA